VVRQQLVAAVLVVLILLAVLVWFGNNLGWW
jgi:hypothetical protein